MQLARLKRVLGHRFLRGTSLLVCALIGGTAARMLDLGLGHAVAIASAAALVLAAGYLWAPTAWLSVSVAGLAVVAATTAAGAAILERFGASSAIGLALGAICGAGFGSWVVVESAREVL